MNKTIHPIDQHIGLKIRARRKVLRISGQKLAIYLQVTRQQIDKYEHGTTKISNHKLLELCKVLQVDITYFFEGFCPSINLLPPKKNNMLLEIETLIKQLLTLLERYEKTYR